MHAFQHIISSGNATIMIQGNQEKALLVSRIFEFVTITSFANWYSQIETVGMIASLKTFLCLANLQKCRAWPVVFVITRLYFVLLVKEKHG